MVRTTYSREYYRDPYYVSAWDVKQYVYCPLIPWIKEHVGVVEPPDINMELGKPEGPKEDVLIRLGVPKPWRYDVYLRNTDLMIVGVVDLVGGVKKLEVVEFKLFNRRRYSHFTSQLLFYAYLVSKSLGPVHKAHIVLGKNTITYYVTEETLRHVERLVERVREVKTGDDPPRGVRQDPHKCGLCWYRRYCPRD